MGDVTETAGNAEDPDNERDAELVFGLCASVAMW